MGIIRKTMSVSTGGLVDFRSDKERTAAYTKGARKQAKQQTKLMAQQNEILAAQTQHAMMQPVGPPPMPPQPAAQPAAWYPDQAQPGMLRWFDGIQWTNHTCPANQPPPPQQ